MTVTAIGPQGPNYTTTRPAFDSVVSGGTDTWFKNCSQAGARDGTFATADFFNVIVDQLRTAIRLSGVTLDGTNSSMLYLAIQAIATAIFNSLIVTQIAANRGVRITTISGVQTVQSDIGTGLRATLT